MDVDNDPSRNSVPTRQKKKETENPRIDNLNEQQNPYPVQYGNFLPYPENTSNKGLPSNDPQGKKERRKS